MRSRGALGALFKRARTDCAKVGAIAIVIRLIVIVLVTVIIILRASSSGCVLRRSKSNSYSNSNRSSISISMSDSHNSSRASGFRQFRAGIVFLEFLAAENLKHTIPAPSAVGCRGRTQNLDSGGFSGEDSKISIPGGETAQMTPWRIEPTTLPYKACDSSACQLSYDRLVDCAGGCLQRRSE